MCIARISFGHSTTSSTRLTPISRLTFFLRFQVCTRKSVELVQLCSICITSPGHETPLASGVSTNVSVDVDSRQYDLEVDVDVRQHDSEQDQDQPAFNHLWNNQYAMLTKLDM
eukprot:scaffold828_cov117-Amphora_coffeaeformis.AAC.6